MVFGFFDGKMELKLDKGVNYSFGDTITGKVLLKLNKPKKARELRVEVKWIETRMERSGGRNRSRTIELFKNEVKIDGEKEYAKGDHEHTFELALPSADPSPKAEGALGAAFGVMKSLSGISRKWKVRAALDIPMSTDIGKDIQINVK